MAAGVRFAEKMQMAPISLLAQRRSSGHSGQTSTFQFVLACDMRFASRQSALFGNPEVGVGLVPGGGALEWFPRLVGRSRAFEFLLSGDDFRPFGSDLHIPHLAELPELFDLGVVHIRHMNWAGAHNKVQLS